MPTKERRKQIRDRINRIKDEIQELKDKIPQLREARREHQRFARTSEGRKIGYQGGDTDERLGIVLDEIQDLYRQKDALYEELQRA